MAESWIVAEIEDGELMTWDGGGDWWNQERENYISEGEDVDIMCSETPEVKERMNKGHTFKVKFTGVSFVTEPATWGDYGYDYGGAWVENDGYEFVEDQAS